MKCEKEKERKEKADTKKRRSKKRRNGREGEGREGEKNRIDGEPEICDVRGNYVLYLWLHIINLFAARSAAGRRLHECASLTIMPVYNI